MEKEQRNRLQKATQDARRLLEEEFAGQLLQTYDINVGVGRWNEEPGAHLQAEQLLIREKLVAWIEHKEAQISDRKEALLLALREMAFTALNRFVALELMEARELVRPCVSGGLESEGFQEFTAVAQGLLADQEGAYRLYLETIFEDVSRELRALFDPRDPASLLWPKRTALLELLEILNRPELAQLWIEDETLGWVYQYFNGDAERKKMREESSAPRNSRELAVRNQFFTPRYVVEFLTDNTLGRIWYEMRQGHTGLKERCRYLVRRPNEIWMQPGEKAPAEELAEDNLSQEELLREPVHIPYRPLKDPREIRMLDPACGSMHFGLYAFDLYLAIYEEAWEIAQGSDEQAKQGEPFAAFVAYVADFANKAAFLREVPRLILLHNIHGVDIDPRATQIARLSLWLRAQRAWQEQGVEVVVRPAITRSNVVCAEPMPGERELLADFVDQQFPEAERGLVQQLLETIFDKMQLAGDAGSLLKIEEEIRDAIDQARSEWQELGIKQGNFFSHAELAALGKVGSSLKTDLQNLTKNFWVTVEERIYEALRDYANQAESGGYQRRLFAEDAAQGFAFIDVCRKNYIAVVMNPPFGEPAEAAKTYIENSAGSAKADIYTAFLARWSHQANCGGRIGAITPRSFIYQVDFHDFRKSYLLKRTGMPLVAELGFGELDGASNRTAAYVLTPAGSQKEPTIYANLSGHLDKGSRLKVLTSALLGSELSIARLQDFETKNSTQLLFRLSPSFRSLLSTLPRLDPVLGKAHKGERNGVCNIVNGLQCPSDFRYIRLTVEVPIVELGTQWHLFIKPTEFAPYVSELACVVNWNHSGREQKAEYGGAGISPSKYISGENFYPSKGVWFPDVSERGIGAALIPFEAIPGRKGLLVAGKDEREIPADALAGYLNSIVAEGVLGLTTPERHHKPSYMGQIPWFCDEEIVRAAADHYWIMCRLAAVEASSELCDSFLAPTISLGCTTSLRSEITRVVNQCEDHIHKMEQAQASFDEMILRHCQASETDIELLREVSKRAKIRDWFPVNFSLSEKTEFNLVAHLMSYLLGAAYGRWDLMSSCAANGPAERIAKRHTMKRCPLGLLQNANDYPCCQQDISSEYPLNIPWDGILVDDSNHLLGIGYCVRQVMHLLWANHAGSSAQEIEQEACEILGVSTLDDWFRIPANFLASHLKNYSKSRRIAPIYWQLSAGNGSYSAWLYYHRLTQDTLYRVLHDFVEPRIQQAEREQIELESQGALSGDAATRLQEAQTLLQDLRLLMSELDLVAPLWNPNLNDGVIINHAILWRITPYTPWQKKCKECWDKLVKGDYDWAHLAFHFWPERVIRNCITDRSLAIAHGLEERLWQETNKGNWLQRQLPEVDLQALIAEHSKPAVQNALERFLAAPPPVAAARTRAPRAAKSSSAEATRRPRGSAPAVDAKASRQTLLVLTAAPVEGLGRNAIADRLDVEAASLTAVIKQLKESGQLEQLGAARGAKYRLTEQGRAAVESQAGEDD